MTVDSSNSAGLLRGRVPSVKLLLLVAAGLLFLSVTSSVLNEESRHLGGVSLVWMPTGLLIGALLCAPRRQWPALYLLGYLLDLVVNLGLRSPLPISLLMSACNMTEVAIAAFGMAPRIAPNPDLTDGRQIRSFLLYGVLLAPAIAALLSSGSIYGRLSTEYLHSLQFWFAADAVGIATVTPLYLSLYHGKRFSRRSWPEVVTLFFILTVAVFSIFAQTSYPLLWLIMLCLLILGIRLGFTASAAALLLVTLIGGQYTLMNLGPVSLTSTVSLSQRILVLQIFVLLTMTVLYVTEVVLARSYRLRKNLQASEARFRLLAEASRDVIVLSDLDGRRRYISPAVTEVLGWQPEELLGEPHSSLVHPDDLVTFDAHLRNRAETSEYIDALAPESQQQEEVLTYRARRKNGTYLWLEAKVRKFHSVAGHSAGFVFTVRDISARKAAEDERQEAFEAAERQATVDGLTGIANRYKLDATLERGWQRALEQATPISLLLIDVDRFKAYNDLYGHLAGDECLRVIAKTIQAVFRRSSDLVARFGGEEFVAVLPDTTIEDAAALCEQVRASVERCGITHAGTPFGVVTVSIGCATEIPAATAERNSLLRAADAALYQAKSDGRNRIAIASSQSANHT